MTMTFWINIFPASVMFMLVTISGEATNALAFAQRHPEFYVQLATYCLLSAIGQSVVCLFYLLCLFIIIFIY